MRVLVKTNAPARKHVWIVQFIERMAIGLYAICWIAVAMDWGLEAIPGVQEWVQRQDERANRSGNF